jgi:hypothetical protein
MTQATKAAALAVSLLGSGALMALAANWSSQPCLGWLALVPLFITIRFASPKFALFGGSLWGLSLFLTARVSDPTLFTASWTSLALLTIVPGIYSFAGALVTRRRGFDPLLLAVGWCGVELLLQPLGLDRGLLLSTQGMSPAIYVVGKLFGFVFVAFLITWFIAGFLAVLTEARLRTSCAKLIVRASEQANRILPRDSWLLASEIESLSQSRAPPAAASL